jgi:hypothetical protein
MMKPQYVGKATDDIFLFWEMPSHLTMQVKNAIYFFRKHGSREILYIGKAGRQSVGSR